MEESYPNSILTLSWQKIIWKSPKYQILIMVPMLCEPITELKVDLAIQSNVHLGVIQCLRRQNLVHFWPPTYLNVDNPYPKRRQNWALFGPTTCLRRHWMPPYSSVSFILIYVMRFDELIRSNYESCFHQFFFSPIFFFRC